MNDSGCRIAADSAMGIDLASSIGARQHHPSYNNNNLLKVFNSNNIISLPKRSRNNCGRANLSINGDVANGPGDSAMDSGGIFCGGSFNQDNGNEVDGAVSCE